MPALPKEMVPILLATGASARLPVALTPRFRVGDAVIARNVNPVGHTRVPRYIKGRRGVVQRDHGVFAFPDAAAHGLGHVPQHVYSVRFMARELWGQEASPLDSIHIDLFDEYMDLDPAGAGSEQPQERRSRRSARPPRRSGRPKARKARRPGVRLKKSEGAKSAASPARKAKKAAKKKVASTPVRKASTKKTARKKRRLARR